MVYVLAIIALIILFVVISRSFGGSKAKSTKTESSAETAEDEYLYDPKTGKRITLEQAMQGYEVEDEHKAKIIPEEDPEQKYTEEEIAVLRIQSWLMMENFAVVTAEELSTLLARFNHSSILKAYEEDLEYLFAAEPDPGLFLVITRVTPEHGHGRAGSEEGEHQLLGILRLEMLPGDALIQPKQALNPIPAAFEPGKEILTEKNTIRLATHEESPAVLQLNAAIEGISNYIAEIQGDYLLIKSNNPATAEEADDLLNCLRAVRRAMM